VENTPHPGEGGREISVYVVFGEGEYEKGKREIRQGSMYWKIPNLPGGRNISRFCGKNMKRPREQGRKCRRKRKEGERKRKKGEEN
jgi:hypothetical protein